MHFKFLDGLILASVSTNLCHLIGHTDKRPALSAQTGKGPDEAWNSGPLKAGDNGLIKRENK